MEDFYKKCAEVGFKVEDIPEDEDEEGNKKPKVLELRRNDGAFVELETIDTASKKKYGFRMEIANTFHSFSFTPNALVINQKVNDMDHGFELTILFDGSWQVKGIKEGAQYGPDLAYHPNGNPKHILFHMEDGDVEYGFYNEDGTERDPPMEDF